MSERETQIHRKRGEPERETETLTETWFYCSKPRNYRRIPVVLKPPEPIHHVQSRTVIICRYSHCIHARSATPTGPPAYNGSAERCTMANKHTGMPVLIGEVILTAETEPGTGQLSNWPLKYDIRGCNTPLIPNH